MRTKRRTKMHSRLTFSLVDSGRMIAQAANVAALLAGAGLLLPGQFLSRLMFWSSILCWFTGIWVAARVAMDASLLRALAAEGSGTDGKARDELLVHFQLRGPRPARTITDRSRGAIRLWPWQIAVGIAQFAMIICGGILKGWAL